MPLTPEEEAVVQQQRANSYVTRTRTLITQLLGNFQLSDALLDEYNSGGFSDPTFLPEEIFAGGTPATSPMMFGGGNTDMTRDEFIACIVSLQAVQSLLAAGHLTNLLKGRKG
jgi:hypothetical protein